jgi:hypothetical protein
LNGFRQRLALPSSSRHLAGRCVGCITAPSRGDQVEPSPRLAAQPLQIIRAKVSWMNQ